MKLITIPVFRDRYFDESSRPHELTVQRWLRDGKLTGRKIGKAWFVDEHAWLANGDPLVERVLETG